MSKLSLNLVWLKILKNLERSVWGINSPRERLEPRPHWLLSKTQGAPWWWGKVLPSHRRCSGLVSPRWCLSLFPLWVSCWPLELKDSCSVLCQPLREQRSHVAPLGSWRTTRLDISVFSSSRGCWRNLLQVTKGVGPAADLLAWPVYLVTGRLKRPNQAHALWPSGICWATPVVMKLPVPQRDQSQDPSTLQASLGLSSTPSSGSHVWEKGNWSSSHLCPTGRRGDLS